MIHTFKKFFTHYRYELLLYGGSSVLVLIGLWVFITHASFLLDALKKTVTFEKIPAKIEQFDIQGFEKLNLVK